MATVAQASAALCSSNSIQQKQQQQQLIRNQQCFHYLFRLSRGARISCCPSLQVKQRPRHLQLVSRLSEVAVDGALTTTVSAPELELKPQADSSKDHPVRAKEANISNVMADVANLIKLVDSRDIVELELKHVGYELVIRKKEALEPAPAPQIIPQTPYPVYTPLSAPPASPAPVSLQPSEPTTASPPPPAAAPASPSSNLPRILSPMAGTFYKCPAPGEPPFVKVGDKVTKGQVICIVEAMKLMNEIEADQSGTIVEILAEDGKPVSVDTPLFAIKP